MMQLQVKSIGKQRPRHAATFFVDLWLRHLAPTRGGLGRLRYECNYTYNS
jgi:hypothetical protein